MKKLNDRLLLELIRKDDEKAFRHLFDAYYTPLCRYANLILKSESTSEEVVMNIYIYIWENRAELEIKSSLKAYMFRSVRNRCLNHIRDNTPPIYIDDSLADIWTEESCNLEIEDLRRFIEEAIMSLPEKCQEVFLMSRNNEMTNREIAEQMNISVKTVEGQMTKALRIIRNYIIGKVIILFYIFFT